jgi:chaperone required for assembly of F1-ATPase
VVKRFYKTAAAVPHDEGFTVALDGRPIRTPAKQPLTVPTEDLATAIAEEWLAQADEVDPHAMPMMRLANTAIDRVRPQREAVIIEIAGYGGSDLVCYHAADPEALVARQIEAWQPLIDWAADRYGANLQTTSGLMHVAQDPAATEVLRDAVEAHDDFGLVALHGTVTATGSLVIGLAVMEARLDADAAWAASLIDEQFQAEKWGEDREALQRRRALRDDIAAAERFFRLSRS